MPEQYRKLLVDTVKERDLKLLEVLKSSDELSYQQRLAVMEYLADVLPDELVGPELPMMTNVMDGLPERVRSLLTEIVGQRDPELLAALLESKEPSLEQREAVEGYLADALPDELVGPPGYWPTERGRLIEHTIYAFLERWPIERTRRES